MGEYYSEGDTRAPTWLLTGNTDKVAELVGLGGGAAEGGFADTETAARWLDEGSPRAAHRGGGSAGRVHGFDLTFSAPKSVSVIRALTDDVGEKGIAQRT